jgi:hypothetical protein
MAVANDCGLKAPLPNSTGAALFIMAGQEVERWAFGCSSRSRPMNESTQNPLALLTPALREHLLANGRLSGCDHLPVVKFFNPVGIGTGLATELDEDDDTLFGLAQLNDAPELGFFSLEEIAISDPIGHILQNLRRGECVMLSHHEARQTLTRMEARLRETQHNLHELERALRDKAEEAAITSRPKARRYNRRMSNWTGLDEETYLGFLH